MIFWPINWVAVLIVVVFSQVLGFLWYGPLFGKAWLKMIGKNATDDGMQMTAGTMLGSILTALVSAYVFAVALASIGVADVGTGILAAIVLWIGIGAATALNSALYSEVSKGVWLLNATYNLVLFVGAGILYTVWPAL
jgi:hypothetical protein